MQQLENKAIYSKTPNRVPSEIGTVYKFYKGHCLRFQTFILPIGIYNLLEEDNLSNKGRNK